MCFSEGKIKEKDTEPSISEFGQKTETQVLHK